MKNKKAQTATDTPILLTIIVFQAFIILCLGWLNLTESDVSTVTHGSGLINFTVNIVTNIGLLGWGNAILFAPLEVCIIYIIAKLIRGGG